MNYLKEANSNLMEIGVLGKENNRKFDWICPALLATVPILQHYIGIVSAGATMLLILFPYVFVKICFRLKNIKNYKNNLIVISPLIVYCAYMVFDHGTDIFEIGRLGLLCAFFVALAFECINLKYLIKAAILIASLASIIIIIQYICYYVLGFHLQIIPTFLLLEESEQWILLAETGTHSITGELMDIYRPSALFLEPAHMFIYCFPLIMLLLLSPYITKTRIALAVLISVGVYLGTSGMGILFLFGCWMLYLGLFRSKDNLPHMRNLITKGNMIRMALFFVIFLVMTTQIEVFAGAFDRVASGEATSGRTEEGNALLQEGMRGINLWIGNADNTEGIEFHLSGFAATLYKYGIIGVIISYIFYVRSLLLLRWEYFWISFIVLVLSFYSAHTHGSFYMLYYVAILLNGYSYGKINKFTFLKQNLKRQPIK